VSSAVALRNQAHDRADVPSHAFAAATFGAEFTGPLPDEPELPLPDELELPLPDEPELPPPVEPELPPLEPELSLLLEVEAAPVEPSVFAAGFDSAPSDFGLPEEYRSAYQPPPLRTKLVRLRSRDRLLCAPHRGQVSGGGSFTFWRASEVWWHWLHSYS
jgi:hypothetical protein